MVGGQGSRPEGCQPELSAIGYRWRLHPAVDRQIDELRRQDAAAIYAQMDVVRLVGHSAARHLREDVYELEAHGIDQSYRHLFSAEGSRGRLLLAVVLFAKHTQKTPRSVIDLALRRRDQWRAKGRSRA
jgi:phage-related protein